MKKFGQLDIKCNKWIKTQNNETTEELKGANFIILYAYSMSFCLR